MNYTTEIRNRFLRLVINDDCDYDTFFKIAKKLEKGLNILYFNQIDDFDSLNWHFFYNDSIMTLSYNTSFGIEIYPSKGNKATDADKKALENLANNLKNLE